MASIIENLLVYSSDNEGIIYDIPLGFVELRKISNVGIYITDSNANFRGIEPISADDYLCILKHLPNSASSYVAVGQYIAALRRCVIDDVDYLN